MAAFVLAPFVSFVSKARNLSNVQLAGGRTQFEGHFGRQPHGDSQPLSSNRNARMVIVTLSGEKLKTFDFLSQNLKVQTSKGLPPSAPR